MPTPSDRKYTESHEWIKMDGAVATLGVTQFAVDQLTDITYVQMKAAGTKVAKGAVVGEVESVKATSDIYSPVAGEIAEVNAALADNPGLINTDPYGAGWLIRIKGADLSSASGLMDAAAYEKAQGH